VATQTSTGICRLALEDAVLLLPTRLRFLVDHMHVILKLLCGSPLRALSRAPEGSARQVVLNHGLHLSQLIAPASHTSSMISGGGRMGGPAGAQAEGGSERAWCDRHVQRARLKSSWRARDVDWSGRDTSIRTPSATAQIRGRMLEHVRLCLFPCRPVGQEGQRGGSRMGGSRSTW